MINLPNEYSTPGSQGLWSLGDPSQGISFTSVGQHIVLGLLWVRHERSTNSSLIQLDGPSGGPT